MLKHQLVMKRVTKEHLEQYNKLFRYVFQVTNRELSEVGWANEEIIQEKAPALEHADVIGWFDNDKLVSQVAVYDFKVTIFNKAYKMGGLTSVGTFPEYANRGLMQKLIYQALCNMRDKKQTIAYLYPYSIPYYRKKGWEIISDKISYEIDDYQLPKYKRVNGEVVRVDLEGPEIKRCYERFAKVTHGALLRDDLGWSEYFRWDNDDVMAAVYYSETEEAEGFVIYYIEEEIFYIKEMISMNEDARTGLWNFVSAHFSMISKVKGSTYTDEPLAFLLEDADITETIAPYSMARIVDVVEFIKDYPFKQDTEERSWVFSLYDPMLEWNQGIFRLDIDHEGSGSLTRVAEPSDDSIDIATLTTMLMGYKSPDYLRKIRRIICDEKTIDMLEDSIEQETPYFSDFF
ncbi:GNAT family N-acetyltransferase [Spirochaetota bacterium]